MSYKPRGLEPPSSGGGSSSTGYTMLGTALTGWYVVPGTLYLYALCTPRLEDTTLQTDCCTSAPKTPGEAAAAAAGRGGRRRRRRYGRRCRCDCVYVVYPGARFIVFVWCTPVRLVPCRAEVQVDIRLTSG